MARAHEKRVPPKRSNSKESGASMLITGAQMREPSNYPDYSTARPAHVPPAGLPDQRDDLRTSSNVSSKDVAKDKAGRFVFAAHPLQVDVDGSYFVDDGAVTVFATTLKGQVMRANKLVRRQSAAQFEEKFVANSMIRWIQDRAVFEKIREKDAHTQKVRNLLDPKQGGPKRTDLIRMIKSIAGHAEEIFKSEPRVLKVNQPVVVFGDIHGNLEDLMVYERLFWKSYPSILPWNYVFLGDYVDRSKYSLETILYLLSQKIVCKHKFFLIRGNHEFRNVNKDFSFRNELLGIFGPTDGEEMWNLMNRVFDFMPMCAVINNRVFCCHGGVPASVHPGEVCTMRELDAIPCPYQGLNPDFPDPGGPAWELVWNDPMDQHEFEAVVEALRSPTEGAAYMMKTGFATNTKRLTGKFFSETATRNFLNTNNLDYILRAHECAPHGYYTKHNGLTTTVFSSSNYSDKNNAAVVIVHEGRIRPVRVKTRHEAANRKH